MKCAAFIFLSALAAAGYPVLARAETPAPAPAGYERYKLVRTRNIFDPERRATRSEGPARPQSAAAGPRTNYLTLTGTMVTSGRSLAFFSGSQSDYSKVVSLREKIADFTVTGISGTQVELTAGGKPTILPVGRQLSMQGGNYTVQAAAVAVAPPAADAALAADAGPKPAASPGAPAAAGGAQSDVQRRMMERRQKELSR